MAIICLNNTFAPTLCQDQAHFEPILGTSHLYQLTMGVRCINHSAAPADIDITIPLPLDMPPQQTISKLSVAPIKPTILTDSVGNKLAAFRFSQVAPQHTVQAQFEAIIEKTNVAYDLCVPAADAANSAASESPSVVVKALDKPSDELSQSTTGASTAPAPGQEQALINSTAQKVVAGESHCLLKLIKLYDFVRGFTFELNDRPKSNYQILNSRVVQCEDAARILAALMQSQNITCRQVSGLVINQGKPVNIDTHSWVEAYLPPWGFVPFDATMGRFEHCRSSRIGQLEAPYIALWKGPQPYKFSATGVPEKDVTTFSRQRLLGVRAPSSSYLGSYLPRPGRQAKANQLKPKDPAQKALQEALQAQPAQRLERLQQAQRQFPHSLSITPYLIAQAQQDNQLDQVLTQYHSDNSLRNRFARGLGHLQKQHWSKAYDSLAGLGGLACIEQAKGRLFAYTKQPSLAIRSQKLAWDSQPNVELAFDMLQVCYDLGDWQAVAQLAVAASQVFPAVEDFRTALMQSLFHLNQPQLALRVMQQMLRANPKDGYPLTVMATLCIEHGRHREAAAFLHRALKLQLSPEERQYYQTLLGQLQQTKIRGYGLMNHK